MNKIIQKEILQILRESGENYDLDRLVIKLDFQRADIAEAVEQLINGSQVKVNRSKDGVSIMRNLNSNFY
jgi:ABC-type dipeptide/oligopeptide/nickel transport system ATPase subunit